VIASILTVSPLLADALGQLARMALINLGYEDCSGT
jgi:hypothetical protein